MKLDINEVHFLLEAAKTVSIKAADAPLVADCMPKLNKEFARLAKLEEKKQAAAPMLEAAK